MYVTGVYSLTIYILGLVISLFDSLGDKDGTVREVAFSSLRTIGLHQHKLLLNEIHAHLARQPKVLCTST